MNELRRYLVVCGPTASGKSSWALEFAKKHNGVLICGDSVQLFKGLRIGSAGPTDSEMQSIEHRLFYSLNIDQKFDVSQYREIASNCIEQVSQSGRLPIVVGGTGLYLKALMAGSWMENLPHDENLRVALQKQTTVDLWEELGKLDKKRQSELHINDRFRIVRAVEVCRLLGKPMTSVVQEVEWDRRALVIQFDPERSAIHEKIKNRVAQMLSNGLVEEVENLLESDPNLAERKPMQSIGYLQVLEMLSGKISKEELPEKILFATRQYAKRQSTWFKKMPCHLRLDLDAKDSFKSVFSLLGKNNP